MSGPYPGGARNMATTLTFKFEASFFECAYQLFRPDAQQPTFHAT
jgi:hypothetical protein